MSKSTFKFNKPVQTIAKYARDRKGNPIGLVAAFRDTDNKVKIGWSFKHKLDRFDRNVAWASAVGKARVEADRAMDKLLPYALYQIYNEVTERAIRYFKVAGEDIVRR